MRASILLLAFLAALAGCAAPGASVEDPAGAARARGSEWHNWTRVVHGRSPGVLLAGGDETPTLPVVPRATRIDATMAWEPSTPTAGSLFLCIQQGSAEAACVEAPSPSRVVVDPEDVEATSVRVYAAIGPGVVVQQELRFSVLLEPVE